MKRITMGLCIAAAMLFAAAPSGAAQTAKKAAKATTSDMAPKKAATGYTGCVEAGTAAGTYQLTHAEGQSGALMLSGSSADLAKHVGHKVTIAGSMSGKAPASKLKVKSVTMVAATCP